MSTLPQLCNGFIWNEPYVCLFPLVWRVSGLGRRIWKKQSTKSESKDFEFLKNVESNKSHMEATVFRPIS